MHTCAQPRRPCGAKKQPKKSLQCLFLSAFLSFFYFSASLKCFLCIMACVLYVCVCMFECEIMRACACGFFEISENTVGKYRRTWQQWPWFHWLSPVLFTCSVSSCRWTASVSTFVLSVFFFSAGTSVFLFLYKVFVFSQREGFTHQNWGEGKTEVPTCPVG